MGFRETLEVMSYFLRLKVVIILVLAAAGGSLGGFAYYYQARAASLSSQVSNLNSNASSLNEQIAALKTAYAASGMRGFWLKVLELTEPSEQSNISPYQIASYYSILHKKDESFVWLNKAFESHDGGLVAIKTDSDFDQLHSDSRFAELLRRMKLPE